MVSKIVTGKSIRGILHYNENKVEGGEARLILASGFAADVERLNLQQKLARFENLNQLRPTVKTNALHITLNFDTSEKLDNAKIQQIAMTYMEGIGFGEQPYLVYRHHDAAHQHVHIATNSIRRDGTAIQLHRLGPDKSEPVRKQIEKDFNLVVAESKIYKTQPGIKPADPEKAWYGHLPTKRAMSNVISTVMQQYHFTSLAEYNAVLQQFNVVADRGAEDSLMFRKKGLLYSLLDKQGNKIGVPIKASAFFSKPTLTNLEKKFEQNIEKRKRYKEPLKEVSAAVKRLLQARLPKIIFVCGDGERRTGKKGDREYKLLTAEKTFRYALINQGFDVDTVSLAQQTIPSGITALVLADPQAPLSAIAIQKIKTYIAQGGNLLIAGEPGRQSLLNPILKTLGVQLMDGMLEQRSGDFAPTLVFPKLTPAATNLSVVMKNKPELDTLPVSMNGVAGLNYRDTSGFTTQPLLVTLPQSVRNTRGRNPDLDIATGPDTVTAATVTDNVKKGPRHTLAPADAMEPARSFVTALALTRKVNGRQQRIFISGDADWLSNLELPRNTPKTVNFYLSTALFSWLAYGEFPVDTSRPDAKDTRVTVTSDHISFLRLMYIYVLPGLILIFGAIYLIRRKRK